MAASAETATQLEQELGKKTSFLELFFDLVFVFAITQVTALILSDPSAGGFLRAAVVLGMIYWAWSGFTWMTNAIAIEDPVVRAFFLLAMTGSFFVALAVPGAYESEGLWFAVPYLVVRTVQVGVYLWGLRRLPDQFAAMAKLAPWFLLAPVVVLVGAFFDGDTRAILWAVSLAIDTGGAMTQGEENAFRISPAHFAERYGLFVIIVLGESIVAIGIGAAELERDAVFVASVAVAFAGVAAFWWAYFDWTQVALERALRQTSENRRGPLARDAFSIFHYPLVLGIVFYAVAAEKMVAHPEDPLPTSGSAALALGVGLFLASFVLMRWRIVRRLAWERLAAGAVTAVVVWLLIDTAAVWVILASVAILVAMILVERARLRELRAGLHAEATA